MTSSFTLSSMIFPVVLVSRQSSACFSGILKARLALSRSLRMLSYSYGTLQLLSRYCFHLALRYSTSRTSGSIFCFDSCEHSCSTFPLLSKIQKSQSFENCPFLHATISAYSSFNYFLIYLSGVVFATFSTLFAQTCSDRKEVRFYVASLSFATLFLAIYILANQCLGKMLRVSLWRMDRQYGSPFMSQRSMNYFNYESYISNAHQDLSIYLLLYETQNHAKIGKVINIVFI